VDRSSNEEKEEKFTRPEKKWFQGVLEAAERQNRRAGWGF